MVTFAIMQSYIYISCLSTRAVGLCCHLLLSLVPHYYYSDLQTVMCVLMALVWQTCHSVHLLKVVHWISQSWYAYVVDGFVVTELLLLLLFAVTGIVTVFAI